MKSRLVRWAVELAIFVVFFVGMDYFEIVKDLTKVQDWIYLGLVIGLVIGCDLCSDWGRQNGQIL